MAWWFCITQKVRPVLCRGQWCEGVFYIRSECIVRNPNFCRDKRSGTWQTSRSFRGSWGQNLCIQRCLDSWFQVEYRHSLSLPLPYWRDFATNPSRKFPLPLELKGCGNGHECI